jgi:hypothetical protein
MYIVGQAHDPKDNEDADRWTLEIHRVSDTDINDIRHYGCMQIFEDSLDLCLLKAKIICNTLNHKGFAGAETMVKKLNAEQKRNPTI